MYKLRLRFKSTLDGVPAKTHAGISPSNLVCLSQRLDVQGSAKRWTLGWVNNTGKAGRGDKHQQEQNPPNLAPTFLPSRVEVFCKWDSDPSGSEIYTYYRLQMVLVERHTYMFHHASLGWMSQALNPLCSIRFLSWVKFLFWLLALWDKKNGLPSMKVQKLKIYQNKSDSTGCKWPSLNAPSTPLFHPSLEFGEFPFLIIGPLG